MRESLKEVCLKKAVGPAVTDTLEKTTQNTNLVVLKLIKETVENSDEKFKKWLQDNIEMFSGMIEMELMDKAYNAKSIRWDDLIIRAEWKKEISDFLDKNYEDSRLIFE